jgi:hypothetical protein
MQAREYLDMLKDQPQIIRLAYYEENGWSGRAHAVVFDQEQQVAVMLEDCPGITGTAVLAGAIVSYVTHPEDEPRIVGSPAYHPAHRIKLIKAG